MPTITQEYLTADEGYRGGRPRIAGRRITVADIVLMHYRLGQSIEEIATDYDLSVAAIHAALAYYHDHRQEIDEDIARDEAFAEWFRQNNPSLLREKLAALSRA